MSRLLTEYQLYFTPTLMKNRVALCKCQCFFSFLDFGDPCSILFLLCKHARRPRIKFRLSEGHPSRKRFFFSGTPGIEEKCCETFVADQKEEGFCQNPFFKKNICYIYLKVKLKKVHMYINFLN